MIQATSPKLQESPVRVCFLIDELGTAGTETQLLALIKNLDRRRIIPHLCLLRGDNQLSQALEPPDCPVFRLGMGSLKHPASIWKAWTLSRFLRKNQIDVLQVYFPDSTYVGAITGWLSGVPAIVRARNNLGHWLTPIHRWLGSMLNAITTVTIANCDAARNAFIEAERPRPESVLVLENGVDLERFNGIAPLRSHPRPWNQLGVVANLRPVKGLDILIHAMSHLVKLHPSLQLKIAGEGPERNALQQQIDQASLQDNIKLIGSQQDIPGFLSSIQIGVMASRAEGMSNAILEQMAAGRAIVATDVGGSSALIDHERNGLLVPKESPQALVQAIDALLTHPDKACAMAEAAQSKVQSNHSREVMVQRFEHLYQTLKAQGKAP